MDLSNKQKTGIVILYTVLMIAVGYEFTPTKTVIQKEYIKQEVKTEDVNKVQNSEKDQQKHYVKTIHEKVNKDGSKDITTTVTNDVNQKNTTDSDLKVSKASTTSEVSKETKTVEKGSSKVNLSLIGGVNVLGPTAPPVYGAHITKQILGPFTIGVFGMNNGLAGASIGIGL